MADGRAEGQRRGIGRREGARKAQARAKQASEKSPARRAATAAIAPLVVAIPKGRVLKELARRLAKAHVDPNVLLADDRTLVRDDPKSGLRFLLLKPDDVPTYVEYGAADLGICGRDILLEREYDLYAPVDLGIGRCRMVVAAPASRAGNGGAGGARGPLGAGTLRVATKFVNVARRHFLARGEQVDTVYVQGSVELAPLTGLSDVIVDLVESGETLRQNGLVELETVCEITSVVIANRVALKLHRERIGKLLTALA
jgi:ATP phosphoribosyltransferase